MPRDGRESAVGAGRRGVAVSARGFGWHHPGRARPAFSGVDLEIPAGQRVLLLGPSGAGKSTLLHALAGLLPEEEGDERLGTVALDGQDPSACRGRVGLMQQDPESSIVLSTVESDVAFGPENLAVPPDRIPARIDRALAAVGLGGLAADRSTSALSGGQKQRLGLAGILAMEPGLLLLDEPTANLDPEGVEEVRDAVVAAARDYGSTLVVVEHRVGTWIDHVDRVVVLDPAGGLIDDGAPAEVLARSGALLAEAGVWVPGLVPRAPLSADEDPDPGAVLPGPVLLRARDLAVTRDLPAKKWVRARRRAVRRLPEPPRTGGALPVRDAAPVAARGIGLEVRPGEHLAVTGENGAGKSTLALTLAGLLLPASGIVEADEDLRRRAGDRASWDPSAWTPAELVDRLGVVFQEPEHQFVRPTVREELELGPRLAARNRAADREPGEDPETRAADLLRRLRLEHLAEANPFTLSGGEKRRLSVGTALATRPRVLVLDEPTFGQDASTWGELVDLLRELLATGTAVVSVTHDRDFVRALGGREHRVVAAAEEAEFGGGREADAGTGEER